MQVSGQVKPMDDRPMRIVGSLPGVRRSEAVMEYMPYTEEKEGADLIVLYLRSRLQERRPRSLS